jgi:hypothetical protein
MTVSLAGHYWYGFQFQGYDDPFDTSQSDGYFTGYEHRVGFTTSIYFRFAEDQFAKKAHQWKRQQPTVYHDDN